MPRTLIRPRTTCLSSALPNHSRTSGLPVTLVATHPLPADLRLRALLLPGHLGLATPKLPLQLCLLMGARSRLPLRSDRSGKNVHPLRALLILTSSTTMVLACLFRMAAQAVLRQVLLHLHLRWPLPKPPLESATSVLPRR